jgi:hypothetical protein
MELMRFWFRGWSWQHMQCAGEYDCRQIPALVTSCSTGGVRFTGVPPITIHLNTVQDSKYKRDRYKRVAEFKVYD